MERIPYHQIKRVVHQILKDGSNDNFISFHSILEAVCKRYSIEIEENKSEEIITVYPSKGYYIMIDLVFILEELANHRIILFTRNYNGEDYTYNIGKNSSGDINKVRLPTEVYSFLDKNRQANIWLSPDYDWYEKHGFQNKELYEAKQQTKYAILTMFCSILSPWISILISHYSCFKILFLWILTMTRMSFILSILLLGLETIINVLNNFVLCIVTSVIK